VYAHPEPKSFVAAMRDRVSERLTADGWQVGLSDLHAMGFNPVASAADFVEREKPDYLVYSLEQRHGWQRRALAPDILAEVEAVRQAELLVLVFPVFWFSVPAIMKGWIDRVFLSGLFYGGKRIYDRAPMAGKRALVVTSLGGRSHMFGETGIHGSIELMLRPLLQGSLGYVGYEVFKPFVAYHVPYVTQAERGAMLEQLGRETDALSRRETLVFPSLDAYDEVLRPLERCVERIGDAGEQGSDVQRAVEINRRLRTPASRR